jgi:hypothetical protein
VSDHRWTLLRAIVLSVGVVLLSPVSPLILVCVPLAVLLLAYEARNPVALAVAVVIVGLAFRGAANPTSPVWYWERAWALLVAGGFVLAGLLSRQSSLVRRSVVAVAIAFAVVAVVGALRPALLAEVDWWIGAQFDRAALAVYQWFQLGGDAALTITDAIRGVAEIQTLIYPALLGLASLCALGVAWYVVRRLGGVEGALGPFREFRFSDQLAWLLILGLALFVLPAGQLATRLGENVVAFMGGLYLVRGTAVLIWLGAAVVTSGWSIALWAVAAILLYPVALGAALVMGLSDTWLDLRNRLGVDGGESEP